MLETASECNSSSLIISSICSQRDCDGGFAGSIRFVGSFATCLSHVTSITLYVNSLVCSKKIQLRSIPDRSLMRITRSEPVTEYIFNLHRVRETLDKPLSKKAVSEMDLTLSLSLEVRRAPCPRHCCVSDDDQYHQNDYMYR